MVFVLDLLNYEDGKGKIPLEIFIDAENKKISFDGNEILFSGCRKIVSKDDFVLIKYNPVDSVNMIMEAGKIANALGKIFSPVTENLDNLANPSYVLKIRFSETSRVCFKRYE